MLSFSSLHKMKFNSLVEKSKIYCLFPESEVKELNSDAKLYINNGYK